MKNSMNKTSRAKPESQFIKQRHQEEDEPDPQIMSLSRERPVI